MSEFRVRPATADDRDVIVTFNCLLADETENKRLNPETLRPGVAAILADPAKGRYWVACEAERIVGQIMHTREWSDWRNGQLWWLQSVYVDPDYRRQGVFRALYEHVAREARDDPEVVGIRLYVEQDNQRARQTYQQLGMQEAGYVVMERLTDISAG